MKCFSDFLKTLSDKERDFIAKLDNQRDVREHRKQLDLVIENDGLANLDAQWWYPYEVIDLGKHLLFEGHEREFVACNGIVLLNISVDNDIANEVDWVFPNFLTYKSKLDQNLVAMVRELGQAAESRKQGLR